MKDLGFLQLQVTYVYSTINTQFSGRPLELTLIFSQQSHRVSGLHIMKYSFQPSEDSNVVR